MTVTAAGTPLDGLARALGSLAARDQPLGARTTYRVGGGAALMAEPADEEELLAVAGAYRRAGAAAPVPVLVVGRGSNLLVADAGFPGLAIVLGSGFEQISVEGTEVMAGAAVSLPVLARRMAAAGLRGLEWAVGVPGSVGGGVRMNAGGHGSDTAATLVSFRWVDLREATAEESPAARLALGYRHSALAPHQVVTAARHRLTPGRVDEATALVSEIVRWRRENQPGGSNAGSVFTNPPGDSAGRLIDACGLKGARVGAAEVSTKHANFIQCDDGGSADDVATLIHQVRARVREATGVDLVPEVQLVGFGAAGPGRAPGGEGAG